MLKRFFFSTEENLLIFPSPSDCTIWQFYAVSDFLVKKAGNVDFDLLLDFTKDLIAFRFDSYGDLKLSETAKYANNEFSVKTILSLIEELNMGSLIKLKTCFDRKHGFAGIDCPFIASEGGKVLVGAAHDFTIDYLLTKKANIKWAVKQRLAGYDGLLEITCQNGCVIWWEMEHIEVKVNGLTKPCHVKYPIDARDVIIIFNSILV